MPSSTNHQETAARVAEQLRQVAELLRDLDAELEPPEAFGSDGLYRHGCVHIPLCSDLESLEGFEVSSGYDPQYEGHQPDTYPFELAIHYVSEEHTDRGGWLAGVNTPRDAADLIRHLFPRYKNGAGG